MITRLQLERFKGFKDATLVLGGFTLLIGTNASGKSNVRDALRFLHGLGRGYPLDEIISGKSRDGQPVWSGIRGGAHGLAYYGAETFALEVACTGPAPDDATWQDEVGYRIEVAPGNGEQPSCVIDERLTLNGTALRTRGPILVASGEQPDGDPIVQRLRHTVATTLQRMRFPELAPEVLRQPAQPDVTTLGDRGEHLAAVLYRIAQTPGGRESLVAYMQMCTPMAMEDITFTVDGQGRRLFALVEQNGHTTYAASLSDGTLRYLGLVALLWQPAPAHFYCFEELEQSVHPTHLHLLTGLIEGRVKQGTIQALATTQSPEMLLAVYPPTLEYTALTYRLEEQPDARIKPILDLPDARRLIEDGDISRLHRSAWFEEAADFLEYEQEEQDVADVLEMQTD